MPEKRNWPPLHEIGTIAISMTFAGMAGLAIGNGQQIPPIVEVGLATSIGYFFGAAVWRKTNGM